MLIIYFIVLLLCLIVFLGFILFFFVQLLTQFTADAPFIGVPEKILNEVVKALDLNENSVLYDLGCGDGRVLTEAIKNHPQIRAVGVEIASFPYYLAKFHTRKYKNIEIKRENIFKTDISKATHIFLYLYPKVIDRLFARIREQCRPGTIIVSCDFEIKNFSPIKVIDLSNINPDSNRGKKLYIYKIS